MKSLKLSSAILSLFISCLIMIMQSCVVYAPPVSIENAIEKGPVKIVAGNHRSVKYTSLIQDSSRVMGIKKIGNSIRYQQIPDNVRYVQVKDRDASAVLTTVAIISGGVLIAAPIIALNSLAESMSGFSINNGGGWCIDRTDQQPILSK
ncbi:MAG TPA: hypothetical protein VI583_12635 [Cyclobacteriaceae bacterium]|nr:hypothetical protein [Cyclobacteriaceae bacterium]